MREGSGVMKRTMAFASVAWAIAGAPGCGGSEFVTTDDAAAVDAGITGDQACNDNAHYHCLELQMCSNENLVTQYGDEATCETRLAAACKASLSAPSTGNSAAHAEACAQAYRTEACTNYLDDEPPAACQTAVGGLANGAACGMPGQCETGFCAIVPGSMCGACAPAPQAGDSCATLTTCGQFLACDTTVEQCSTFAAAGAACNRSQLCGDGLYCVGATSTQSGVCQPAGERVGATCDPTGKSGPGCDRLAGLTCNSMSDQCATIQFVAAGAPCGTVGGQLVLCAGAGTCSAAIGADAAAGETCSSPANDGASCNLVSGPFCLEPARCIVNGEGGTSGTCQLPSAADCH
jgi:hypothetical protein